ncbi:MAG: flagellar biosynthesis protein FliQ [Gemmatimonadaceae bacterium]
MTYQLVVDLARHAILTTLVITAPLLLVALGVGLLVSVFQSLTQIQEQTLSFLPKLAAAGGIFLLLLPWMLQVLVRYTTELFRSIPAVVS